MDTLETKALEHDLRLPKTLGREPAHLTLANKRGEMVWIPTKDLHIDRRYQAALRERAVNRIANSWNWIACGCLSVSLRKDGSGYYIFDGQHRWSAAKLRGDIAELPCIVFELDDEAEEAAGFVATNTERRIPKLIERYSALLMIRDPIALKIDQLTRQAGRTIEVHSGPTTFSAVTALARNLQDNEAVMTRVWPVVVNLCKGGPITGRVMDALYATERRMPGHQSLADPRWHDRLMRVGAPVLAQAIRVAQVREGSLSQEMLAWCVTHQINRNLRSGTGLELRKEREIRR